MLGRATEHSWSWSHPIRSNRHHRIGNVTRRQNWKKVGREESASTKVSIAGLLLATDLAVPCIAMLEIQHLASCKCKAASTYQHTKGMLLVSAISDYAWQQHCAFFRHMLAKSTVESLERVQAPSDQLDQQAVFKAFHKCNAAGAPEQLGPRLALKGLSGSFTGMAIFCGRCRP